MKIEDIKALVGQDVWVFDRGRDKYIKRTVKVLNNEMRLPYYEGDPRGFFKVRPTVYLTEDADIVTDAELPEAKKRHAARRKAEKQAEAERVARVERANAAAKELLGFGVQFFSNYGHDSAPVCTTDGFVRVDLTLEQAETLIGALKAKESAK